MKFCRDCVHCAPNTASGFAPLQYFGAKCKLTIVRKQNPVNGLTYETSELCQNERMLGIGNKCGPDGKLFQPKPAPWWRFWP